MFDKDRPRMLAFRDFSESDIHAIQAPTLILDGDEDVVLPEHALGYSTYCPMPNWRSYRAGMESILEKFARRIHTVKSRLWWLLLIEEFLGAPAP
jgi:hypothetical protein